jgi:hypothetical protein
VRDKQPFEISSFHIEHVMPFDRLKPAKKYLPRNQELDPQVDQTISIFRAYQIAAISTTIRG